MLRVEKSGHVSFEADDELYQAEHQIQRILAALNPNHPHTLQAIMDIVKWYGGSIDKAWSTEYSERTFKDAQNTTSVMLASLYAGMDLAGNHKDLEGELPDNENH